MASTCSCPNGDEEYGLGTYFVTVESHSFSLMYLEVVVGEQPHHFLRGCLGAIDLAKGRQEDKEVCCTHHPPLLLVSLCCNPTLLPFGCFLSDPLLLSLSLSLSSLSLSSLSSLSSHFSLFSLSFSSLSSLSPLSSLFSLFSFLSSLLFSLLCLSLLFFLLSPPSSLLSYLSPLHPHCPFSFLHSHCQLSFLHIAMRSLVCSLFPLYCLLSSLLLFILSCTV